MGEQVHPRDSPRRSSSSGMISPSRPLNPSSEKSSGTYVIQVPKEQIYRYPPPENAARFKKLSDRKRRRSSCCCRCLCWTFGLIALLLVLLAATAGILYLVFRPEAPKYTVDRISIRGFNLTSPSSISPEFDATVRADNPNDKIGIYYEKGSSVVLHYSDVKLCDGVLPVFYQSSNNVTIFQTPLKGSNVLLSSAVRSALAGQQKQRNVPFKLNLRAPVKIKVGAAKTWTITIKVKCDITTDSLTASSKILSKDCDYSVKLW